MQAKITKNAATSMNKSKRDVQKQLVEELKVEWKSMWTERYNDKVKAEGISVADYERLHVNRGTVIHATRNFKALNFKDILKENLVENPEQFIPPSTTEGGWNMFIKVNITKGLHKAKRVNDYTPVKPKGGQPKKGGRGWLHNV